MRQRLNLEIRRVTKFFLFFFLFVSWHPRSPLPGRFVTLRAFLLWRRSSCPQVFQVVEFGERESQQAWLAGGCRLLLLRRGRIGFPVAGAVATGRATRTSLSPQMRRIGLHCLTLPVAVASNHRAGRSRRPVVTSWFGDNHRRSFGSRIRARRSGILEQLKIENKKMSRARWDFNERFLLLLSLVIEISQFYTNKLRG